MVVEETVAAEMVMEETITDEMVAEAREEGIDLYASSIEFKSGSEDESEVGQEKVPDAELRQKKTNGVTMNEDEFRKMKEQRRRAKIRYRQNRKAKRRLLGIERKRREMEESIRNMENMKRRK